MHEEMKDVYFFKTSGPDNLHQPAFPSPPSCLPEAEQKKLDERIEAANALLLNLALSNEQPEEGRRKSFDGLTGLWVRVTVIREEEAAAPDTASTTSLNEKVKEKNCSKAKRKSKKSTVKRKTSFCFYKKTKTRRRRACPKAKIPLKRKRSRKKTRSPLITYSGHVHLVGRDFVLLKQKKRSLIIPLEKVHSIKSPNCHIEPLKEPALLHIDPNLRRSLMFNFGETVACSPELIQLFFRMTLPVFLLQMIDKKMKIMLPKKAIIGCLHAADKESLTIMTTSKKEVTVPFYAFYSIAL